MVQLSEETVKEMRRALAHARKRLEWHDQRIAEIKRMREEQEKRLLNQEYC